MLIALGLLALLSAIAFANTFRNDFVYDDLYVILENRLIKQLDQLPTLFTTDYWAGTQKEGEPPRDLLYRPLVMVSYALNYAVGGANPFGYHLVNLLLHLAASFLVYTLARQLDCSWSAALVAAALFAVHPLHTEAVTYIVGRAELLMALGVLLALTWYIQGGAPAHLHPRYALAALGAFTIGLLSKEQAMVLPLLLACYDLLAWKGLNGPVGWRGLLRGVFCRYVGFLLVLGGYLVVRGALMGSFYRTASQISILDNPLAHLSGWPWFLTVLKVAGKYLWLVVWPRYLSPDYSYNQIPSSQSLFEPAVLWAVLAWGSLLALAAWSLVRGRRAFFAVGFTLVTFLPASNLLVPTGTIMGERLFYLPLAGLCFLVGLGWERLAVWSRVFFPQGRAAGVALLALILALLTGRTILRNRDWRDDPTVWLRAAQTSPNSARVRKALGTIYIQQGKLDQALHEFETVVQIWPGYLAESGTLNRHLGVLWLKKGRIEEAIAALQRAIAFQPDSWITHYNLGLAYVRQRRWAEAEAAYRRALTLEFNDPAPYNSLSFVLAEQGRFDEALQAADEAIQRKPDFPEAHYNRARALEALGRPREAIQAYERVLQLYPAFPPAERRLLELRRHINR